MPSPMPTPQAQPAKVSVIINHSLSAPLLLSWPSMLGLLGMPVRYTACHAAAHTAATLKLPLPAVQPSLSSSLRTLIVRAMSLDGPAGPGGVASSAPQSPTKRRRVEWGWECPACGTKHPTGSKMLLHMHKCCVDLLPSAWDLPHIQRMSAQDYQQPAGQPQQQQDCAAGSSSVQELQQLLEAAKQQEHTLRMRALRLRYIDEAKQQAAAAAAEDTEDAEDNLHHDQTNTATLNPTVSTSGLRLPATAVQQQHSQPAQPSSSQRDAVDAAAAAALSEEAAAVAAMPGAHVRAEAAPTHSSSSSSTQGVVKKRARLRSAGRTPVRSIEEVMQEMQLPKARVVRLLERAPRSIRLVADSEPLQVVHEDERFLAVCKPPGLRSAPVHRYMGGSAVNRMIGYLGAVPHLLHRLDMDTSGVLLAAKDAATASLVNAQFQNKQVSKAYLALCLGTPQQQHFTVGGPIGQHPSVQVARVVDPDGLPAVTHVQVLAVSDISPQQLSDNWGPAAADPAERVQGVGCCLVCCRPVTGRTHQIRVHMAHAGHPLVGDDVYGLQGPWISRQALHAAALTLQDPTSLEPVTFVAPPPDDFTAAAAALKLDIPPLDDLHAPSTV